MMIRKIKMKRLLLLYRYPFLLPLVSDSTLKDMGNVIEKGTGIGKGRG